MDFTGQSTLWYVLAVLMVIYLFTLFQNRRRNKRRKGRKFMENRRRNTD